MRLYEHEGKELLRRHGVPVPGGVVLTEAVLPEGAPIPSAVKAQVLAGKRGKAGGVRLVSTEAEALEAARSLLGSQIGGLKVERVLVEERLAIAAEYYVSLFVDRVSKLPALLVTPAGGVEVEEVAPDRFLRLPVHPFTGIRGYHVRAVRQLLQLHPGQERELSQVLHSLWAAFLTTGATLVEINPLVLTEDGRLVAADAKVNLDDRVSARFPEYEGDRSGLTGLERVAAERQAVGIDLDGEIALIASGAGVLMATADSVKAQGGRLGPMLDLGGFPRSAEAEAELFRLTLKPGVRVILPNFFTQVLHCDQYAEAIVKAFGQEPGVKVVARLKGHRAEWGREILRAAGMAVSESYEEAVAMAVAAARREG